MQIHQIEGYIQTLFIVEYKDKLMLLDGGCRCDVSVVEQFITQQLQRNMRDLKLVLVSHMHPDHAGGAHLFRQRFGCRIASTDSRQQWYHGFAGRFGHLVDLVLTLYVAYRKGKAIHNVYYHPHLQPDIILQDGQCIPDFDDWLVYATPGHTDRDLSFLHQPSQQMYVGDMILKLKNNFISPFPIYQPDVYKQSLNKLLQLNISRILMAHDGFSDISADQIEQLITKSTKRPLTVSIVAKYKIKKALFSKNS